VKSIEAAAHGAKAAETATKSLERTEWEQQVFLIACSLILAKQLRQDKTAATPKNSPHRGVWTAPAWVARAEYSRCFGSRWKSKIVSKHSKQAGKYERSFVRKESDKVESVQRCCQSQSVVPKHSGGEERRLRASYRATTPQDRSEWSEDGFKAKQLSPLEDAYGAIHCRCRRSVSKVAFQRSQMLARIYHSGTYIRKNKRTKDLLHGRENREEGASSSSPLFLDRSSFSVVRNTWITGARSRQEHNRSFLGSSV